jgi:heptosyltransferase-2
LKRILVIRGGAIGDFVLTLPAIKLLREGFPQAHVEILGHPHIVALAERRFYADAIRSIESGSLATFFAKGTVLPVELTEYFGSFDLIVSYLFDPDAVFRDNLKRCRIKMLIAGPSKPGGGEHASLQLARPLEQIGLHLRNKAAVIYPADEDREFALNFLGHAGTPIIALHPGSGSESKNWPIENWEKLGSSLFSSGSTILVIGGEADEERLQALENAWKDKPVRFVRNIALPHLAALLQKSTFVGHDSGISHIAAAVGGRCVLLFGPTDPAIWAPANENVIVLRGSDRNLCSLGVQTVVATLRSDLSA